MQRRLRIVLSLFILLPLLAGSFTLGATSPVQETPHAGTKRPAPEADVAARARGTTLTFAELDRLLLERFAGSEDGRAALAHLVRSKLLGRLERESGIEVRPAEIDRRWLEVDEGIRASGEDGIEAQLKKTRLTHEEFRRYLCLSIVHERLTRRALGLDDEAPVTGEQQEMWLDQVMAERGCADLPFPRDVTLEGGGVVARCAEVEVTLAEYLPHLRRALSAEDLRRACYQLLLDKRLTARMPDLAPGALDAAIAEEIERRRVEAESDPKHMGVSFEKLLEAQGVRPSSLRRDPVIRITAMSRLWVERSYDENALKAAYANERDFYDGTYGEAVELGLVYIGAARFPNDLNPRSFEAAERELIELGRGLRSFAEFQRVAARRSEAPGAREDKGVLGFVTRLDDRVPEALRCAAFDKLALRTAQDPTSGEGLPKDLPKDIIGPLRVATGCVLLWLGERRAAPTWERMSQNVRIELRRRFVEDEVLPEASVRTWMDE